MKHARIFDPANPQHRTDLYVGLLFGPRPTQTDKPKDEKHVDNRR